MANYSAFQPSTQPHEVSRNHAEHQPLESLTPYILDKPPATGTPPSISDQPSAPTSVVKDGKPVTDITVTPIQTPGWNNDSKPGTSADTNIDSFSVKNNTEKSLESEIPLTRPDLSPSQELILDAAKEGVGKDLWKGTKYEGVVNGGKLAAGVSASEVLKASGFDVDSPLISGVEQQVKQRGFTEKSLSEAKAGDMVVYHPSENDPSKRIGFVGDPNSQGKPTIYQMDAQGKWMHREMKAPANAKVYSPPGTCLE